MIKKRRHTTVPKVHILFVSYTNKKWNRYSHYTLNAPHSKCLRLDVDSHRCQVAGILNWWRNHGRERHTRPTRSWIASTSVTCGSVGEGHWRRQKGGSYEALLYVYACLCTFLYLHRWVIQVECEITSCKYTHNINRNHKHVTNTPHWTKRAFQIFDRSIRAKLENK